MYVFLVSCFLHDSATWNMMEYYCPCIPAVQEQQQTFILQISEFAPKWEGIFFHPCRKPWPLCFDYRILSTSEYHLWAESDQYSSYRLRVEIPRVSPGTHFLLGDHFGASH
uniref:Uncharacterized protein n=1 Tax=Macaca fascicularis TaxID=9541 RepID=Q9GMW6_MACFA|nr:hypothetical protein [Macaca fascicularis]